nr:E3 ubiquitin-protein ligase MBR2-like [Ipomoea batatas]
MQGGRSILDSLTESIDLNQGLVPSSSSMDRSSPWDNMLDPVGSRFSNSVLAASEGNAGCTSAPSFSGWDQGESSSAADVNGRIYCSDLKAGHMWPSSSSNYVVADQGSEERGFESSNVFANKSFSSSYGGNHPISRPSTHHFNSNHSPGNVNITGAYHNDGGHLVTRTGAPSNAYKFGGTEAELIPAFAASSDNTGTSYNSGYMVGNQDVSGSSWGTWGLSGKRKTLEGSSRQLSMGGSSSSNPRAEDIVQHNVPACYNSSGSLGISSQSNADFMEQCNSRNGHGSRLGVADGFPPLSINSVAESSTRINPWGNIRNQESVSFGLPPIGAAMGHSTVSSIHMPPRPFSINDSSDMRQPLSAPLNPSHTASQSQSMHGPSFPRGMHSFPWNGSHDSQGGGSSGSNMVSGGRSGILRDETRFRSSLRNNAENRRLNSATEARNFVQDTTNWNVDIPSGSGIGPSSLMQSSHTTWVPNQNLTSSSHQRLSEFSPWTLFPPAELESASRRGHISSLHSATTSEEPVMPTRRANRHSRPYNRSSMIVEVPGDDHSGWRALAGDIEGRHRMATEIRQVLNAMRRVENLHAEDYMMYEPFMNGVAEFHDRHRDMRLDVDNMTYEELLALEERIGNVNTGLSEESILKVMKQRKYESTRCGGLSSDLEPCCICQEEYVSEDEIGITECGHEFHMNCIKQWLMVKNLCPICKVTALNS